MTLRILIDAARLDIADLNFETARGWSDAVAGRPWSLRATVAQFRLFLLRLAALLLGRVPRPGSHCNLGAPIWLYGTTANQLSTLGPVAALLGQQDACLIAEDFGQGDLPPAAPYLWSVLLLPASLVALLRADRTTSRRLAMDAHNSLLGYGHYVRNRRLLALHRPRLLVVGNDHSFKPRAFLLAARHAGVPVAYVQHASVGGIEPGLTMDHAFLEGSDSLASYLSVGPASAAIYLAGQVRMDSILAARSSSAMDRAVGIATALADSIDRVVECAAAIAARTCTTVVLRPHPRDPRDRAWIAATRGVSGLHLIPATAEPIGRFLARLSLLVVSTSNAALEAALIGLPIVRCAFAEGEDHDPYGFLGRGLFDITCTPTLAPERVAELLAVPPPPAPGHGHRLAAACATFATPHHGRSAAIVAETLRALSRELPLPELWQHDTRAGCTALYRLKPPPTVDNQSSEG